MRRFRLVILSSLVLLMVTATIPHDTIPSNTLNNQPNSYSNSPFGANVYKIGTELKSIDKGDVSTYYQAYDAGWQKSGYDAVLFGFCSDCQTRTPTTYPLPGDGDFESLPPNSNLPTLNVFANDGFPFWNRTFTIGTPGLLAEDANPPSPPVYGKGAFHSKAMISDGNYQSASIIQEFGIQGTNHRGFWYAPLASDLIFTGQLRPELLTGPDALIVFEFDLSYWNQSSVPTRMFFVYHDPTVPFIPVTPLVNNANTIVYDMSSKQQFPIQQYTSFRWNLTDYAVNGFGLWRGLDTRILSITIGAWSRNNSPAELYLDNLSLQSQLSPVSSHNMQEAILSHWNASSPIPMYSGVTDLSQQNNLDRIIWFGTNAYPTGKGSVQQNIQLVQSQGGYPFLIAPFDFTNYYNGIVGLPVYSENASWNATGTWIPGGTGLWDNYLNQGIPVMGYVQNHAYFRNTIQYYTSGGGPATYVYSDALNWQSIVEAMAQGRSFGEYGWIDQQMTNGKMNLQFSAENDQVGMGRFPIYVSSTTQKITLHINIDHVPNFSQPFIRIIEDGNAMPIIQIRGGQPYAQDLTFDLPQSGMHYFRYEVGSQNNPILAFSNPIFFVHTASLTGNTWIAETPSLAYGAANSSITNIVQDANSISFTVKAPPNVPITTSIYSLTAPVDSSLPATALHYDDASKVLKVTTVGPQQVIISYSGKIHRISLGASPTSIIGLADETLVSTISIGTINGLTGPVNLSQNIGDSCKITPLIIDLTSSPIGNSSLDCKFGSAGNYTVTLDASNSIQSNTTNIMFTIRDFILSLSQNTLTTDAHNDAISTITIQGQNGYTNNTILSYTVPSNNNNGITCSFTNNGIVHGGNGSLQISCHGAPGTYVVSVKATTGPLTHITLLTVNIIGNSSTIPPPPFLTNWPFIIASGTVTVLAGVALTFRNRRK